MHDRTRTFEDAGEQFGAVLMIVDYKNGNARKVDRHYGVTTGVGHFTGRV